MEIIQGGVTAAQGFRASGVRCGVKNGMGCDNPTAEDYRTGKGDLALILSDVPCAAAATYTKNLVKAAPLHVTMHHLTMGCARGIVANSGNANACAPGGHDNAVAMCQAAAVATGLQKEDFVVASTGVIGQTLNIGAIEAGMPYCVANLSSTGSHQAATAIMTTDTTKKEVALTVKIGGQVVTIGAIAKGSGMIHPNMGTMLAFVTTDCAIHQKMLHHALQDVVTRTFNRVTVDGDTSTNDMCVVLANGLAQNPMIDEHNQDYETFTTALYTVCEYLARAIAADGEGAGRLVTCTVRGTRDEQSAEGLAKSVVGSSLVKAAMFGADANWGRVLCAMGYAGVAFDPETVTVAFQSSAGEILVCHDGVGLPFDEELAKKILIEQEVTIDITLQEGSGTATCWGCDLTYDYVRINGDYRS